MNKYILFLLLSISQWGLLNQYETCYPIDKDYSNYGQKENMKNEEKTKIMYFDKTLKEIIKEN